MIEFEGKEYIVDDPTTNAYNLLNYINEYLAENNVKNKKGEVVQFKINLCSPIWLIIFGLGYMTTVLQKIMYAVGQAFSIGSCSDQQVLSLAQIARVERKQGSYSAMTMRVTAGSNGCVVPVTASVTVKYEDVEYKFTPVMEVKIAAGATDSVYMTADKTGPVYITSNSITKFDNDIFGVESCYNLGSEPGTNLESISTLRSRIQQNESVTPINSVINALNGLTGVTRANAYYNISNNETSEVAGHSVPPRTAILFVQGYSKDIAETYFKYMYTPTVQSGDSIIKQTFTAVNGQKFTIGYFPPEAIDIYVKVHLNSVLPEETKAELKAFIASLSNSLPMGTDYTQAYIIDQLSNSSLFSNIIGVELSTDGEAYGNTVVMGYNNIGIIQNDNAHIVLEEA